jgi:hypothetical protein
MRSTSLVLALTLLAVSVYAGEPRAYQGGKLLRMDSVACTASQSSANNEANSNHQASEKSSLTRQSLCQEYVLQADQVVYRLRPRDVKHPALLPIGEFAQFRLNKNKMILRVESLDNKEHEYNVISISPRGDSTADASPVHLNHLQ